MFIMLSKVNNLYLSTLSVFDNNDINILWLRKNIIQIMKLLIF